MQVKQKLIEKLIEVDRISAQLNATDRVICMSHILQEACETAGVAAHKIVTLGNRVSTLRHRPLPQRNYDPGLIRGLFIGRLEEQKNIHGIVQALLILKAQGWRIRLDVCGGKRKNTYLREATAGLQKGEWRYRGAVPNRKLTALFAHVDMYLGPSLFEGFQIPLIEALACGKPCVASDQPPASEIITPELGALVDPTDADAIAQGILNVKTRLNDARQALQLRAACRQEALQKWDYFVISRQEAELYWQVLEDSRQAHHKN